MSIEWDKIEAKPDKAVKVEGQFLLDQRAKIADLESNLHQSRAENKAQKDDLSISANKNQELEGIIEETRKELEVQMQNLKTQIETAAALEKELGETKQSISQLEGVVEESYKKVDEWDNAYKELESKFTQLFVIKDPLIAQLLGTSVIPIDPFNPLVFPPQKTYSFYLLDYWRPVPWLLVELGVFRDVARNIRSPNVFSSFEGRKTPRRTRRARRGQRTYRLMCFSVWSR